MNKLFLLFASTLLIFTTWFLSVCPLEHAFSFLFLLPVLLAMTYMCLQPGPSRPALTTITVFTTLFYFVAPMVQLLADPDYFVSSMPVTTGRVVFANLATTVFCGVFLVAYRLRGAHSVAQRPAIPEHDLRIITNVLVVLAFGMALWGVLGVGSALSTVTEESSDEGGIVRLLKHKVAFMLPFLALALKISERNARRSVLVIGLLILAVLATKNPLYDRRNALGPIYISLAVLFVPALLSSGRRYFTALMSIVVVGFPAVSILTHLGQKFWLAGGFSEEGLGTIIYQHFIDVHYDTWSSLATVYEMVSEQGPYFGKQLLGTLLFFVPRTMWQDKPITTGYEVGRYLMDRHYMWFDNLSTTLPAEAYIDFGMLGIPVFALLLAWFCRRLDSYIGMAGGRLEFVSALYFSIYLMFVMRGALMSAFAYGVGAYIALRLVPYAIYLVLRVLRANSIPPLAREQGNVP
jgi:hypothetical protein